MVTNSFGIFLRFINLFICDRKEERLVVLNGLKGLCALPWFNGEAPEHFWIFPFRFDHSESRAPVVALPVEIFGPESISLATVNKLYRIVLKQVQLYEAEEFAQPYRVVNYVPWLLINILIHSLYHLFRYIKNTCLIRIILPRLRVSLIVLPFVYNHLRVSNRILNLKDVECIV
jgi:hypothetical protein